MIYKLTIQRGPRYRRCNRLESTQTAPRDNGSENSHRGRQQNAVPAFRLPQGETIGLLLVVGLKQR